ncbi:MAG: hypothetical protein QM790_10045 [Nibricoccus sp.]
MSGRRLSHLPSLLSLHAQELGFLWSQRAGKIRSPEYRVRELMALEERIEAHADALASSAHGNKDALVALLVAQDPDLLFSGAFTVLRLNEPALVDELLDAYEAAEPLSRQTIVDAICFGTSKNAATRWLAKFGREPQCLFDAARVTAFHVPTSPVVAAVEQKLRDPDVEVRKAAWRAVWLFPPGRLQPPVTLAGALDDHAEVRRCALEAAAWARQPWILKHCQTAAAKGGADSVEEIRTLAVIGSAEDLKLVLSACAHPALGSARFEILGSTGQPECISTLIAGMLDGDAESAELAGIAFMRITGLQLPLALRPTKSADPELQIEVQVPDGENAAAQWREVESRFAVGGRWCGGVEISGSNAEPTVNQKIDMLTRYERNVRLAFAGQPHRAAVDLLRLPLY